MTFNLGTARGSIVIDASGVRTGVQQAQEALRAGASGINNTLNTIGSNISQIGQNAGVMVAPLVAGMAVAANASTNYSESLGNIQSVTNATAEEMAALDNQLRAVGVDSRYGLQQTADTFYDVAGGVTNAANRMPILTAAIATAQAGNANLNSTTAALISTMNSYNYTADQTTRVSDVLTRTVGMGVGSMDQFASAFPAVTGLAASMGIEFEDLAGAMAFLTTKGNTASASATQLGGMMSALLTPSERMREALNQMGFASGRAMVEQHGLVGAYRLLVQEFGVDAIGPMVGQMEAMRGVTALLGDEFAGFSDEFVAGIDGATAAAESIQMQTPAAQFALMKSQVEAMTIAIGDALVPGIVELVNTIRPMVAAFTEWIRANPQIVAGVGHFVGIIAKVAPVLVVIGRLIPMIGGLFGALLNPINWVIAAITLFGIAFETNFMGLRDIVEPIINNVVGSIRMFINAVQMGYDPLQALQNSLTNVFGSETAANVTNFVRGIVEALQLVGTAIQAAMSSFSSTLNAGEFQSLGTHPIIVFAHAAINAVRQFLVVLGLVDSQDYTWGNRLNTAIYYIVTGFQDLLRVGGIFLNAIGERGIIGALRLLFANFEDGSNYIGGIIASFGMAEETAYQIGTAINNVALMIIDAFVIAVGFIQTTIIPGLQALVAWVVTDGLPLAANFITTVIIPAITNFIGILAGIWTTVAPPLFAFVNWIIAEGLPLAVNFITGVIIPAISNFINTLASIWNTVAPPLFALVNWIITEGLPIAVNFIQTVVMPIIETLIGVLVRVWNDVSPFLFFLLDWIITTGLPIAVSFIQDIVIPGIQFMIDKLIEVWTVVQPFLQALYDWFITTGLPFIQTAVENAGVFIQGLIDIFAGIWTSIEPGLNLLYDGVIRIFGWILDNAITPVTDALSGITGIIGDVQTNIANFTGGLGDFAASVGQGVQNLFGGGGQPNADQVAMDYYNYQNSAAGQAQSQQMSSFISQWGASRDIGGDGIAGNPYMVGPTQQGYEAFIPGDNGTFIPNLQREIAAAMVEAGGGGGTTIHVENVVANSYAEGQAAARGLKDELENLYREGGNS